jgi:dTDP-4-dehydrorhamnose 3,5-epimerase
MRFTPLPLAGAMLVEIERREDERGSFGRVWCAEEFAAHGIEETWRQSNVSCNRRAGTLRGMHYQAEPYGEAKLVRCTRGAAYDVLVDVRPDSPTFQHWTAIELTSDNDRQVYIPRGFAHGFQTLTDDTELHYLMSTPFHLDAARGLRWNDPALGIRWPEVAVRIISERDQLWPLAATA